MEQMNFSFTEAYNLPVYQRHYYIIKKNNEIEKQKQALESAKKPSKGRR